MYVVDSGASLHPTEKSYLFPHEKKTIRKTTHDLEIQTANGIVRSVNEAKVFIQELSTCLNVKLVDDSPSALSLGRLCDELEIFLLLARKKTSACCTDNVVPLVAVTQQTGTPSVPAKENPVPDTEVEESMHKLLERFPESVTDNYAVFVRTSPLLKKRRRWGRRC